MKTIKNTPEIFAAYLKAGRLHPQASLPLDIFSQSAVREALDLFDKIVMLRLEQAVNLDQETDQLRICEVTMDILRAWKPHLQSQQQLLAQLGGPATGRFHQGQLHRSDGLITGLSWILRDLESAQEPCHQALHLARRPDGVYYLDALQTSARFEVHTAYIDLDGQMIGESLVACPQDGTWKLASEMPLPPPSAQFWQQFSVELRT